MANPSAAPATPSSLFTRRNVILMLTALVTIVVGYLVLVNGSASLAAVLLVLGYVIIFPLALIL